MDPRRKAKLDARHAAKVAARRDGSAPTQTYPANRGSGLVAQISDVDARYQAKLQDRVDAFMKPKDAAPEAKPKGQPAKEEPRLTDADLERATRPDPKPEAKPKGGGKG